MLMFEAMFGRLALVTKPLAATLKQNARDTAATTGAASHKCPGGREHLNMSWRPKPVHYDYACDRTQVAATNPAYGVCHADDMCCNLMEARMSRSTL